MSAQLFAALRTLVDVVQRMDAEIDSEKPSEEEYRAALTMADAAIAVATCVPRAEGGVS